ncbi:hypothetical protein ABMA27_010791 [Loxostege sticticalis]|uniref:C2H2-type domain-containing protein n=1 Tax=Loxostege sticticalis TaxID=481309 RepID=A0ABR3H4D0_LOXSC
MTLVNFSKKALSTNLYLYSLVLCIILVGCYLQSDFNLRGRPLITSGSKGGRGYGKHHEGGGGVSLDITCHDGKTFANFLLRRALLIAPTHEGFMRMPYDLYCPSLQKDRKLLVDRICQQCGQYFCTKKRAKECHGHHTAHETETVRPTRILTLRGREILCVVREDDGAEWLDETKVNMSQTSLPITTASEEEALPVVSLNESLATPWNVDNIN